MYSLKKIIAIKSINAFFIKKASIILILNNLNLKFIQMPQKYYIESTSFNNKIIFINKYYFASFFNNIINSINELLFIRSVRLFIRGLGFRMYTINNWVYNIIFNWINNIYMFCPLHAVMRVFKKKIILLSKKWGLLKTLMLSLLGLKRLGPYEMRGIKIPRSFLLKKKPSKKNVLR